MEIHSIVYEKAANIQRIAFSRAMRDGKRHSTVYEKAANIQRIAFSSKRQK